MFGKMFISCRLDDVSNCIVNGGTVIALVDDDVEKYRYINCAIMGVLLPPYESLSAEIDGDTQTAASIYYSYLMTKIDIIANILAALNMNKTILIHVPVEESMNFGFVTVFTSFFLNVFGISIGNDASVQPGISNEPVFVARRADALFINGLIPFDEYCAMMPINMPPSENACGVMMRSINYRFNSMIECVNYCSQYINAVREQKSGMFSPVFRVKPQ